MGKASLRETVKKIATTKPAKEKIEDRLVKLEDLVKRLSIKLDTNSQTVSALVDEGKKKDTILDLMEEDITSLQIVVLSLSGINMDGDT